MSGGENERSPGNESRNKVLSRNQARQKEKPGTAEANTEQFQQHQYYKH